MWIIITALLFSQTDVGSGTSPKGSLNIFKESLKPPMLEFTAELQDKNNNGVLEGYEAISLNVIIKNSGEGMAKGVKIMLSGTSNVINYLGKEKMVGDILPGTQKTIDFKATLPGLIAKEEGTSLIVKVVESRPECSCPDEKSFRIAIKPVEKKTETEETFVDVDITPQKRFTDNNRYGIIIGISDYQNINDVKYARKDAEVVKEYFKNVLGIPAQNIYEAYDDKAIKSEFEEIFESKLEYISKGSFLAVYYSGHITPKQEDSLSYFVPYEAEYNAEKKTYSMKRFYEALQNCPANDILVILDGCFSGESRSILAMGKRPLVISKIVPQEVVRPKFVVLAAAKENQMSNDYDKVKHGLFTYYFLKALKEGHDPNGNGWIELSELYEYVKENVSETARTELYCDQEPTILPEGILTDKSNLRIGKIK